MVLFGHGHVTGSLLGIRVCCPRYKGLLKKQEWPISSSQRTRVKHFSLSPSPKLRDHGKAREATPRSAYILGDGRVPLQYQNCFYKLFAFFSLDYRHCLCVLDGTPLLKYCYCLLPVSGLFVEGESEQGILILIKSHLPIFSVFFEGCLENTSLLGGHKYILLYFLLKGFRLCLIYIFNSPGFSVCKQQSQGRTQFWFFSPKDTGGASIVCRLALSLFGGLKRCCSHVSGYQLCWVCFWASYSAPLVSFSVPITHCR